MDKIDFEKERMQLAEVSFPLYEKEVMAIIDNNILDERYICTVLDYLMDFSFHNGMLFLFRTLIRYYMNINEPVAMHYINKYNDEYGDKVRYYYDERKN